MRQGGSASGTASLVERDAVLAALADHLAAAASGHGRVVLLRGEAGVGKTAVVRRFVEWTGSRARVLIGGCDPLSTPGPLGPLLDVAAELGPDVDCMVGEALAGRGSPHAVFRALLAELDVDGLPTILIMEDVHWADGGTFDLLRFLGRRIQDVPVLVLATYRHDEVDRAHPMTVLLGDLAGQPTLHRLTLEPLSRCAVDVLAAGRSLDVEELYRVTGGNPFFVTEVMQSIAAEIPRSISEVVLGRLARLTEEARTVVEAVAVIGSPAEMSLIKSLVPGVHGVAAAALSSGLLCPDGTAIAFRHEIARLAVLESIPRYRRMGMHDRVLTALRSEPVRAEQLAHLAHHAEESGDRAAVLEFAPGAGAHASALHAHAEAAAQYERALRHTDSQPREQRALLLEDHSRASFLAGDSGAAIDSCERAIELRRALGDRRCEGDNLRWLAHVLRTVGRMNDAADAADAAERVLEALPPGRELAELYVHQCLELSYHANLDATTAYAHRAIELAKKLGDPRLEIQARYYVQRARVSHTGGGWADLEKALESAVEADLEERTGFLFMTASAVASLHRDRRGRAVMERAEAYCATHDMLTYLLATRAHGALHPLHQGRWTEAAETAAGVLAHPRAAPIVRTPALAALGLVRARRGDPGAAEPLDEAVQLLEPGFVLHMTPVWEARAEAAWLSGDYDRAETEARTGLAALTDYSDPWLCGSLARWVRLAGGESPRYPAAGPFALELAGEWPAAARAWDELGCPYDAGLVRLAGDVPALLSALETFESLDARPAAAIASARLRAAGVRAGTRGPRTGTRADPLGLTSRQREILDLVGEGLTDSQIAGRLHLSAKTVNHHVGAVLAKLGVHSRGEAVRTLVEG